MKCQEIHGRLSFNLFCKPKNDLRNDNIALEKMHKMNHEMLFYVVFAEVLIFLYCLEISNLLIILVNSL